jgi:ectoine hydroxylase-related dioxygenase (phytanoyl-CoA dioxygenase family)
MSTTNPFQITLKQKRQYQEEGYFILDNVIADSELETLRTECSQLIAEQEAEMDRLGTDVINLSKRNSRYFVFLAYKNRPQLGDFIFSDAMAEICRATIGGEAFLFWEQFVVKGSEKGSAFAWHQDSGYCDGLHKPYFNCWIPLDDVNEDNGTLYILPFSVAGTKERIEHKVMPNSNERVGYFGEHAGAPVVCKAGSIAVFSSTSFHRSGTNQTNGLRRIYSVQYSPEPVLEPDGSLKGLAEPFLSKGARIRNGQK